MKNKMEHCKTPTWCLGQLYSTTPCSRHLGFGNNFPPIQRWGASLESSHENEAAANPNADMPNQFVLLPACRDSLPVELSHIHTHWDQHHKKMRQFRWDLERPELQARDECHCICHPCSGAMCHCPS